MMGFTSRSINPQCSYIVLDSMEYGHILTVLNNLRSDFRYESFTAHELEYVHDALVNGYNDFIRREDIVYNEDVN